MNILKTFTMTWWQGALFKWGVFTLGIAVGCFWPTVFVPYLVPLIIFAALTLGYVTYVWWKQ